METVASEMSVTKVSAYLSLRHRTLRAKIKDGRCAACNEGESTIGHVIWACPHDLNKTEMSLNHSLSNVTHNAQGLARKTNLTGGESR